MLRNNAHCLWFISLTLAFLFTAKPVAAQNFFYPEINKTAKTTAGFVPDGWKVLDSAIGDLNYDKVPDYALVLQYKDSTQLEQKITQPRMLIVLLSDRTTGNLVQAERSNTFILNHDNANMKDPYAGIKIDSGVLSIRFHMFYHRGSWFVNNNKYWFRFQNSRFELIRAESNSLHRGTHEYEKAYYDFLAKECIETMGNEDDGPDVKPRAYTHDLLLKEPQTLKAFKKPFTWEVTMNNLL